MARGQQSCAFLSEERGFMEEINHVSEAEITTRGALTSGPPF